MTYIIVPCILLFTFCYLAYKESGRVTVQKLDTDPVLTTKDPETKGGSDLRRDPDVVAGDLGLVVFHSRPDLLMLDVDDPDQKAVVLDRLLSFNREAPLYVRDSLWTTSKSGKGLHLYVVLSEGLREGERLALQAALGSDPVRELLSTIRHLLRVAADDPFDPKLQEPSVLFETKAEAGRVTEFLDRHPVRERVVREGT